MPDYQNYLVAFEITKENETKSVQLQQQLNMVFFYYWEHDEMDLFITYKSTRNHNFNSWNMNEHWSHTVCAIQSASLTNW